MDSCDYIIALNTATGTSSVGAHDKDRFARRAGKGLDLPGRWLSLLGNTLDSTVPRAIVMFHPRSGSDGWYTKWEARLRSIRHASGLAGDTVWPAPTTVALSRATDFLERLHECDVPPSNVSQSAIGGIAFTFLRGNREIFVEFLNNGNVYAAVSDLEDLEGDFPTYRIDDGDFGYDRLMEVISNAANA